MVFIFGCVGSSLLRGGCVAEWGLLIAVHRLLVAVASRCGAQARGTQASVAAACGLPARERRLCGCGARAQLLRAVWDLPRSEMEPMSPALVGGFFTTEPSTVIF